MRFLGHSLLICLSLVLSATGSNGCGDDGGAAVAGVVRSEEGPVAGATVRVQATDRYAITDAEGRFALDGEEGTVSLSAWAPGYYIGGGETARPGDRVEIHLERHPDRDDPDYAFLSAFAESAPESGCENCHSDRGDPSASLPFDEWRRDAHSNSASNPRFLTMYAGTDVDGHQSPPTQYGYLRDYGAIPLPPDPDEPYYGPGYRLDFQGSAGSCAACHLPAAAVHAPYGTDPLSVDDVGAEGVACDFCHKVWDVILDPTTGLPYAGMPGVLSFALRRPSEGHQFFGGQFDDVAPGEDVYVPLYAESRYCAPCHFGQFWGTQVYNSYGEWLQSPYSDPETGQTCQDCHMPSTGATRFALEEQGGRERDPSRIASHRMLGVTDEAFMQSALSMEASADRDGDGIAVIVTLTNDRTGHHVPTGSPLRQLILLVTARDADGTLLAQTAGPVVPEWGGVGDPAEGYYAGLPGTAYARILREEWTEVSPTGAYWNPTRIVSDNRLAALAVDTTEYRFDEPDTGPVDVEVRLLFRRAFIELVDWKGWDLTDLVMADELIRLEAQMD